MQRPNEHLYQVCSDNDRCIDVLIGYISPGDGRGVTSPVANYHKEQRCYQAGFTLRTHSAHSQISPNMVKYL